MPIHIPVGGKFLRQISPTELLQSIDSTDLVDIVKNIIKEYFQHLGDSKNRTIFKEFLNGGTLAGIGEGQNLTKERVRQIVFVYTNQIRKLLLGEAIHKPRLIYTKGAHIFKAFEADLVNNKAIIQHDAQSIFKKYTKHPSLKNLSLVMHFCGYDLKGQLGINFFHKDIAVFLLVKKITILRAFLKKQVFYTEFKDLCKKVKVDEKMLTFLFKFLPDLDLRKINGVDSCRLPIKHLSNIALCTQRILYDADRPMHFSEITKELSKQERDLDLKFSHILSCRTEKYPIVAIGKSGEWALASWGLNTDSIPKLIEEGLTLKNQPMTLHEIYNYVNKKRPMDDNNTIRSNLTCYKKFVNYSDGTFGLKKWKSKKVAAIKRKYPRNRSFSIYKDIVAQATEILKGNGSTMLLVDLVKDLKSSKGYECPTIYNALSKKSTPFRKEKISGNLKNKIITFKGKL